MKKNTLRRLVLDSFDIINEFDDLLIPSKWKGKLSNEKIFRINESYKKFCYLEPLLREPNVTRKVLWEKFLHEKDENQPNIAARLAEERAKFKEISNDFFKTLKITPTDDGIAVVSVGLLSLLRQGVFSPSGNYEKRVKLYTGDVTKHPAFEPALTRMRRLDLEFRKFKSKVLSKSAAPVGSLEDLLELLMQYLQSEGDLVYIIEEKKVEDEKSAGVEDEIEVEFALCSDDELKAKLTAVLQKVKFKTERGANLAIEKMMKGLSGKEPKTLEELKGILKNQFKKPLRDSTITLFANAIADCFDLSEDETEESEDALTDTKNLVKEVISKSGQEEKLVKKVLFALLDANLLTDFWAQGAKELKAENSPQAESVMRKHELRIMNLNESPDPTDVKAGKLYRKIENKFGSMSPDAYNDVAKILKELMRLSTQGNPIFATGALDEGSRREDQVMLLENFFVRWQDLAGI